MGFEVVVVSAEEGDEEEAGREGEVVPLGVPLLLWFKSQTRSFFSAPPVASMEGEGLVGKATARTM